MNIRAALTRLAVIVVLVPPVAGQNAFVYYDHRPGPASPAARVTYLYPGDRASIHEPEADRHAGPPPRFRIAQGSRVCVKIENANPLLYSYTIKSDTISVAPPADLSGFLAILARIIERARAQAKALGIQGADSSPLEGYAAAVQRLAQIVQQLADVKAASDTMITLTETALEADSLHRAGRAINDSATTVFSKHSEDLSFKLIHEYQMITWSRLEEAALEISRAGEAVKIPITFCELLESNGLRTILSIARKDHVGQAGIAARPVNDSTLVIFSDPKSTRSFEMMPAGVFSLAMPGRRRFSVEDGVIRGHPDHRASFNPGIVALWRVLEKVWATLGVAKSDEDAPDLFLGIALRGGDDRVGTNIVLGFGVSLTHVVAGLKEGREGDPLPANVTDIATIVDRELHPGLGVIFTVSGLSFVKRDEAKE
jgi:hypothetical protein